MLPRVALPLSLLQLLAVLPSVVRAQTSNVSCTSVDWTYNSLGQTPCVVAATLLGNCQQSNYFVQDLTSLHWGSYVGAFFGDSQHYNLNQCICTVQVWNLFAACSQACQAPGHTMQDWATYTATCNSTYTGTSGYPKTTFDASMIPGSTEIAPWANMPPPAASPYLWDQNAAEKNATTTSTSSSTSGTPTQTGASASGTSTGPPGANTNGPTPLHSSANTGAIVGGVVGGLAVLGLIGLGAMYILKRQGQPSHSVPAGSRYMQQSDGRSVASAPYPWMHPSIAGSQTHSSGHHSFGHGPTPPPRSADPTPLPLPWEARGSGPIPEVTPVSPATSPSPHEPGIRYNHGRQPTMGDLTRPDSYQNYSPYSGYRPESHAPSR